ncbi:MAG: glutaminyl-peptide cyclotransferase [Planctomycetota bacterium]
MAKPKPRRRSKKSFPPPAETKQSESKTIDRNDYRPMRWDLVVLFVVISLGGSYLFLWLIPKNDRYTYEVIQTYDHDPKAFTQGLVFDDGFLWESTGRYGQSSVRKIDLESGEILKKVDLSEDYFGEGLTVLGDKIYQITWKAGKAFVHDKELEKITEFKYPGQGWGLTTDGIDLIMSNGTAEIKYLDPETFKEKRSIWVKKKGGLRAGQLNELEYANNRIYANLYQTDLVYEINPGNGAITKIIDLSGLWPSKDRPIDGILNGIAINPDSGKFLFTGKLCPKIYEVRLSKVAE